MNEPIEQLNAFLESIREINGGETVASLDQQLREMVIGVRATGKKGKLTLSLEIEPRGAEQVTVSAEIKSSKPKEEKPKAIFFCGEDGSLQREHPKQTVLSFEAKANP